MRRLVQWAARLYPAAWRERYGAEMEALLEDVGPGGGDLWDIVRGALFMQMTSLSFWKILAGCALAGVLAAGIWSAVLPNRYVSTAVLRISGAPPEAQIHLQRLQQSALSRRSLSSIIIGQNLYANERKKLPMEDIIQEMRNRDVRIRTVNLGGDTTFAVEFRNENPAAAQATVRAIVSSLIEQNLEVSQRPGNGVTDIAVLDPASLPSQPDGPNRIRVIGNGLGAGLVLGLVCGAIWSIVRRKERWSLRRIGGFAAAGMALGLTVAFLIPDEFVSTAVVRAADRSKLQSTIAQVMSEDSLAAIIREDHLYSRELSRSSMHDVVRKMRTEHIRVQEAGGTALTVSFRYPDRLAAQTVTRDLVNRFVTINGVAPSATEVLDSASLPQSPSSPNRMNIALLGTAAGILLGLVASRFRRPKLATA